MYQSINNPQVSSNTFPKSQNVDVRKTILKKVKFIESCIALDISIFEKYIHDEDKFENKRKYQFLDMLKDLFLHFQIEGKICSVKMQDKECIGCSKGKNVLQFIVYTKNENEVIGDFGFVIDLENDQVQDIYRCWQYKDCCSFQIKPEGLPAIIIT